MGCTCRVILSIWLETVTDQKGASSPLPSCKGEPQLTQNDQLPCMTTMPLLLKSQSSLLFFPLVSFSVTSLSFPFFYSAYFLSFLLLNNSIICNKPTQRLFKFKIIQENANQNHEVLLSTHLNGLNVWIFFNVQQRRILQYNINLGTNNNIC